MKVWNKFVTYCGLTVLLIGSMIEHIEEFLRGEV